MKNKLHTGPWTISDLKSGKVGLPKNGFKVFSCFHCGGGSSFGYKLAGFDVLGGVEIDPKIMAMYRKNHNPKHSYLMGVQDFKSEDNIPEELIGIDVLDGSPPCSSFSMAGSREEAWGKSKKFREGQANQVLDDLFFHFIEVAKKLQPKIVVAENVKGLILGNARGYVKEIFKQYDLAGYETQLFLLNSATMGVPQRRERTFFVSRRKDLCIPKLSMEFKEHPISYSQAIVGVDEKGRELTDKTKALWMKTLPGESLAKAHEKGNMFTWSKLHKDRPPGTATSGPAQLSPFGPWHISDAAQSRIQSFPDDYDFDGQSVRYVCGMSVPPLMMQRVAAEVARALDEHRRSQETKS